MSGVASGSTGTAVLELELDEKSGGYVIRKINDGG